jgi:hypothetical protein
MCGLSTSIYVTSTRRARRGDRALIEKYTEACVNQADLDIFTELAQDFHDATILDGYKAYPALRELFEPESEKRKIVGFLMAEEEGALEVLMLIKTIERVIPGRGNEEEPLRGSLCSQWMRLMKRRLKWPKMVDIPYLDS